MFMKFSVMDRCRIMMNNLSNEYFYVYETVFSFKELSFSNNDYSE